MGLKTLFIKNDIIDKNTEGTVYDGTQLRSLFAYLQHGLLGDSAVAWIGPCAVSFEHMVDGEDLRSANAIEGGRMLHFIIEIFSADLLAAVAIQRLFASICLQFLCQHRPDEGSRLRREGDDLYLGSGKLSISIATVSPVSALIHFAINCTNDGTPVETAAFSDLAIDPARAAQTLLSRLADEYEGIREATMKVKWVR